MIQRNLIDSKLIKNRNLLYFVHYDSDIYIIEEEEEDPFMEFYMNNEETLKKNDWELHKKYVKEGVNLNEVAKIIQNDEIEKLQEISAQKDFDYNQIIKPSIYERCSFINEENVSLIDYAAYFSAIKCFKYLLMNNAKVNNTGKYAIAGGNLEIVHLCEQNHSSFENAYETAIEFHRNDIFHYFYDNKIIEVQNIEKLGKKCIVCHNYEIFSFLIKEGLKIREDIINVTAKIGNLYLVKYFLQNNQIPNNILLFSSESGNFELVQYILEQKGIDINAKDKKKNTSLIKSSSKGYTEIVKLLLNQKEININAKDKYGWSALMKATLKGHVEIVKLLLEQKGIDINAHDDDGSSAFIYACSRDQIKIVELFLEHDETNINDKNDHEWTVLMIASQSDKPEIVKLLLDKEIDFNAKDKKGNTALIWATEYNNAEIVKLLLGKEGIDINAANVYLFYLKFILIK